MSDLLITTILTTLLFLATVAFKALAHPSPLPAGIYQVGIELCMLNLAIHVAFFLTIRGRLKLERNPLVQAALSDALFELFLLVLASSVVTLFFALFKRWLRRNSPAPLEAVVADFLGMLIVGLGTWNLVNLASHYRVV